MSDKEITKQAFAEAEKEARDKQISEVKKIVTKTLEKLDDVKKKIREFQEEEKILRMDIDDLKEGRLDRISERQEKDPEAKKISVVLIIKEKEVIREVSPWYWPYTITWQPVYVPSFATNTVYGTLTTANSGNFVQSYGGTNYTTITCSAAKDATVGTYDISGHIVHLR